MQISVGKVLPQAHFAAACTGLCVCGRFFRKFKRNFAALLFQNPKVRVVVTASYAGDSGRNALLCKGTGTNLSKPLL